MVYLRLYLVALRCMSFAFLLYSALRFFQNALGVVCALALGLCVLASLGPVLDKAIGVTDVITNDVSCIGGYSRIPKSKSFIILCDAPRPATENIIILKWKSIASHMPFQERDYVKITYYTHSKLPILVEKTAPDPGVPAELENRGLSAGQKWLCTVSVVAALLLAVMSFTLLLNVILSL